MSFRLAAPPTVAAAAHHLLHARGRVRRQGLHGVAAVASGLAGEVMVLAKDARPEETNDAAMSRQVDSVSPSVSPSIHLSPSSSVELLLSFSLHILSSLFSRNVKNRSTHGGSWA